jgi:catechol 2,3-dioxygenase-like lactoylglutathione lyase family enzyme
MITGIDHVYAETADWDSSVAFWEGLGFTFAERWGSGEHRAGRLVCGEATVVLAEIAPEAQPPALAVHFALEAAATFEAAPPVRVVTPLEPTHWGTRWLRVADPDGRIHVLEERA